LLHLRSPRCLSVIAACMFALGASSAQASPTDAVAAVSTNQQEKTPLPSWMKKFAGSSAELGNYFGTSVFYTNGYTDPYVSTSLYLRPNYDLGTRFKLSVNARLYFEREWTQPDNPLGRRFYPYDGWLSLVARNLAQWTPARLTLGATARLTIPLSYESRYAHLLTAVTVGPSLGGELIFGRAPDPDKRWRFSFMLLAQFTKYVHSQDFRGVTPGDTSNCRDFAPGAVSFGPDGAPAASDTCGGPINPSFGVRSAIVLGLARGKWTLGMTMLVDNTFLHYVAPDMYTDIHAVDRGREDTTWGIIGLTYSVNDHFAVNAGISSQQPALDSRVQGLRFPFFDSSGGNANNFTQAFLSLTGTL